MYAQELGTLTKPVNDPLLGYRSVAEDPGNNEAIRILTRAIMIPLGQIKQREASRHMEIKSSTIKGN